VKRANMASIEQWLARGGGSALVIASTLAAAQAPPPGGFPGTPPVGPPVEIESFEVTPAEIAPGAPTTLRWEAINAYTLSIEPDLGVVATRGTRELTPAMTTTYTLTASGTGGAKTRQVTVTVTGTVASAPDGAGARAALAVPRLPDGKPDLSGLYIGGREVRLVAPVQLQPGAEAFRVDTAADDLGAGVDCLPPGVPAATMLPFPLQIVHKPDVLAIMYEAYHLFRIIPIGQPQAEYLAPAWMGHSVATWDGDVLVVDVRGFNDKTRISGYRHTESLHVTERYERISFDTIAYEATVEDPNVFATPVRYTGTLTLRPDWEIGEYVCTENNQDYETLFETD
jgi:hypothetical protein